MQFHENAQKLANVALGQTGKRMPEYLERLDFNAARKLPALVCKPNEDHAPIRRATLAFDETLALHAINDARDGAVLRSNPLGKRREGEISQFFEQLDDGELRAGQTKLRRHALGEPARFGVEVNDRLDDRIDLGLGVGR